MIGSHAALGIVGASITGPTGGAGVAGRAAGVLFLLAATSTIWVHARRRAARFRRPTLATETDSRAVSAADLGRELGTVATFLQFSAATCATCPQVSRRLADLADSRPGVVHIEIYSEKRMDLVRRFSVFRTPTVLLLDPDGAVRSRMSGPLTPESASAALTGLALPSRRGAHV